jgi:hypothetical protein
MSATTVGIKIKKAAFTRAYRVKASEVIYAGAMVGIDSSGRAVSPTETTGLMIVGLAKRNTTLKGASNAKGDNVWDATGFSDGDFMVEVEEGRFSLQNSSAGDAILSTSRRKVIYCADNQTLALTSNSGARSPAGIADGLDDAGLPVVALSLEIAKALSVIAGTASTYTQTYSTADRTVANPTSTTLTDNGGGAAADGTIGAVTAPTALTDSTTGTASTTLAAITSPTAVTNSTGGSTGDTTLAAITTGGGTYPDATPVKDALAKLAVLGNANAAAVILLKNDAAQFAASQAQNRAAIIALTDAVKELSTAINLGIADDLDNRKTLTAIIDDGQALGFWA